MIRVFLVDDHPIVRQSIRNLIDAEADCEVVGEAGSMKEALETIGATSPLVAVLDVRLPDGSGIDLCRAIRKTHPHVLCVMLTAYEDARIRESAKSAGAARFVLKTIRENRLVESIRDVARTAEEKMRAEATA